MPGTGFPARPEAVLDREAEWDELAAFATDLRPGATLGIVSGRRRQGKTLLLEALTRATGGFYFAAQEAAEALSLRRLAEQYTARTGVPVRWDGWPDAVDALLALGAERPVPVVLDEFPDLVRQSPALPSVLQSAFRPGRPERTGSRTRLLVCGSALCLMGKVFGGTAPLRGRAALDLVVHPFGFRQAARLWGVSDLELAVLVHAVVGGTPAYRGAWVRGDTPRDLADFDAWVCRTVLDPGTALFREGRSLLAEEPELSDRALHHSVLTAVADGRVTRGGVAEYLGCPVTDLSHPLAVLQDCGLLAVDRDGLRPGRSRLRIVEPLLAFDHAVARPALADLELGRAEEVWRRSGQRFRTRVVAPHFARLCRVWAVESAAAATFGGQPAEAVHGTVADPATGRVHEAGVVVRGPAGGRADVLLSVGDASWDTVMGVEHLRRLRGLLEMLARRGEDVSHARPACYGAAGFTEELRAAGRRGEVVLVGLDRLYTGA